MRGEGLLLLTTLVAGACCIHSLLVSPQQGINNDDVINDAGTQKWEDGSAKNQQHQFHRRTQILADDGESTDSETNSTSSGVRHIELFVSHIGSQPLTENEEQVIADSIVSSYNSINCPGGTDNCQFLHFESARLIQRILIGGSPLNRLDDAGSTTRRFLQSENPHPCSLEGSYFAMLVCYYKLIFKVDTDDCDCDEGNPSFPDGPLTLRPMALPAPRPTPYPTPTGSSSPSLPLPIRPFSSPEPFTVPTRAPAVAPKPNNNPIRAPPLFINNGGAFGASGGGNGGGGAGVRTKVFLPVLQFTITNNLTCSSSVTERETKPPFIFVTDVQEIKVIKKGDNFLGSISGNVLQDIDEDGTGDEPISDVIITLMDSSGTPIATTLTDTNGRYLFSDLPPGKYIVTETNPLGFIDINDADGEDPNKITTTIGGGKSLNSMENNFLDGRLGSISGFVFEDIDDDDGDKPISGELICIITHPSGEPIRTTRTDNSGRYWFPGLSAGTYIVTKMNSLGLVGFGDNSNGGDPDTITTTIGGDEPLDSSNNDFVNERRNPDYSTPPTPSPTPLPSSSPSSRPTFTNIPSFVPSTGPTEIGTPQPTTILLGSISGHIKEDVNNDNVGDVGIPNVTIILMDETGSILIQTTATDTNGRYIFAGLPLDNYMIVETNPSGYMDVSDVDGVNDGKVTVTLTPTNLDSTDIDFVDERPTLSPTAFPSISPSQLPSATSSSLPPNIPLLGSISGHVREDIDNDDVGEVNLPGVLISLEIPGGVTVATTRTDTNGVYIFSGLPVGTYIVTEMNPLGLIDVRDVDEGDPNMITVTIGGTEPLISLENSFVDRLPTGG